MLPVRHECCSDNRQHAAFSVFGFVSPARFRKGPVAARFCGGITGLSPLPSVVGGCSGPGGSVCWHWSCSKPAGLVAGCGMCAPLSTPLAGESTEGNRQCLSLPTEVGAHRLRCCRASGRAVMWMRTAVTTEACSLRWSLVSPCWKSDCPMLIVRTRFCATRWSSSMLG